MSRACTLALLKQKKLRTMRFAQLLAEMRAKGYHPDAQKKVLSGLQALYRATPADLELRRELFLSYLRHGAELEMRRRHRKRQRFWKQMALAGIGLTFATYPMQSGVIKTAVGLFSLSVLAQVLRFKCSSGARLMPEKIYKNRKDRDKITQARMAASIVVERKYAYLEQQLLQRQKL